MSLMMMMILEIVMELALKQVELRGALICYGAIENHHNMQKLFNLGYFQSFRFTTDIKGIRIMLILFHPPPPNTTRMFLQEDGLDQYKAEVMMLFILNTLNIIGVGLLILYTGNGLLRLPCGLIRPTHGVRTRRTALEVEIDELE